MPYPTATYRLQFRDGMTFDTAVTLVPYWRLLGISHLYASPIFTATKGSTHGYDVTDANAIDPAIGGRDGFERLSDALGASGIGLILDIVPNHMAASLENSWWRSVVEWGQDSPFATMFDIDWSQKLTLPFLGEPFPDVLQSGGLQLRLDDVNGCLSACYAGTDYPLLPSSYGLVLDGLDDPLAAAIAAKGARVDANDEDAFHLAIRKLCTEHGVDALNDRLAAVSLDRETLDAVFAAQPFRLIYWKDAAKGLNYRRFFEVAGLVGLRVEDNAVFDRTHELILDLVRCGRVDGLRVDHIDGLSDPAAYLKRLRAAVGPDVYLTVEKILGEGEALPAAWPVSGSTGYEFITALSNLLVDAGKMPEMTAAYERFTGERQDYEVILNNAKTLMVTENFEGEVDLLVRLAAAAMPDDRTLATSAIRDAIRGLLKAFPVYRTYGDDRGLNADDAALLDRIASAAAARDGIDEAVLRSVVEILKCGGDADSARFRQRFQQVSGPVMAKAMEDTAFYRFNRLLALNEVGGDPGVTDLSVGRFHALMEDRARTQPQGLSSTSTHDTKRGEDARARLAALSEAPDVWEAAVLRWTGMNAGYRAALPTGQAPGAEVEWALYQALAGVWPEGLSADDTEGLAALAKRFGAYAEKMLREAKQRTNWSSVDAEYEGAVQAFVNGLLSASNSAFLQDFTRTLEPFRVAGIWNGLTQTLVKLAAPGIPDVYQGSEVGDFSLVDPDNRRMPDYRTISGLLAAASPFAPEKAGAMPGAAKMALIAGGLALRAQYPEVFTAGSYVPLRVSGPEAEKLVAFARVAGTHAVIAIAPVRGLYWTAGHSAELAATRIHLPADLVAMSFYDCLAGNGTVIRGNSLSLGEIAAAPFGLLAGSSR